MSIFFFFDYSVFVFSVYFFLSILYEKISWASGKCSAMTHLLITQQATKTRLYAVNQIGVRRRRTCRMSQHSCCDYMVSQKLCARETRPHTAIKCTNFWEETKQTSCRTSIFRHCMAHRFYSYEMEFFSGQFKCMWTLLDKLHNNQFYYETVSRFYIAWYIRGSGCWNAMCQIWPAGYIPSTELLWISAVIFELPVPRNISRIFFNQIPGEVRYKEGSRSVHKFIGSVWTSSCLALKSQIPPNYSFWIVNFSKSCRRPPCQENLGFLNV